MLTERQAHKLIDATHRAALDPGCWQDLAVQLDQTLGCGGIAIHAIDTSARTTLPVGVIGFDPAYLDSYIRHYMAISPWPDRILVMPQGKARRSTQDLPEEDYVKTEFYQDWMRPQEDRVASVGVRTTGSGPRSIFATANLRRRDRDRLEAPALQIFDWLHVHLAHAAAVNQVLSRLSARALLANQTGEEGPAPSEGMLFVTPDHRLIWVDAGGASLFGQVLRLSPLGRLGFLDPDAQSWLDAVIRHMQSGDSLARLVAQETTLRAGPRLWRVQAVWGASPAQGGPLVLSINGQPSPTLALVFSELPLPHDPADRLRRQFRLSKAEAQVALCLAQGMETDEIALARGVSRNTVRNQIQSVLSKLDAHHRGDIIRLLTRLLAAP